MGPHIPEEKLQALLTQIDALKAGDTLVLAGSIPSDIPDDIYEQILKRLQAAESASSLMLRATF